MPPPRGSSLAGGLEHGGVDRLAGALAGPNHKLERGVIALDRVDRTLKLRLALASARIRAASEQKRVPEHHHALVRPQVEMPDPKLFVDDRQELQYLDPAVVRHLEIERAGEMQRFKLGHPLKGNVVVGPMTFHRHAGRFRRMIVPLMSRISPSTPLIEGIAFALPSQRRESLIPQGDGR